MPPQLHPVALEEPGPFGIGGPFGGGRLGGGADAVGEHEGEAVDHLVPRSVGGGGEPVDRTVGLGQLDSHGDHRAVGRVDRGNQGVVGGLESAQAGGHPIRLLDHRRDPVP